jgi:restriction endonuclease S subunit
MQTKNVNLISLLRYQGLSSGYSFRGKIRKIHNGGARVIQLKDFENNYSSIGEDCYLVDAEKIKSKYYLSDGDILFISKGTNNYALVYEQVDDMPTIASSALFTIRLNANLANPKYIAWYINQVDVQNYLKSNEAGTYVTSINKKTIEEIPIKLPSLATQNKIAIIASLHKKEQIISQEILELKHTYITNQLLKNI